MAAESISAVEVDSASIACGTLAAANAIVLDGDAVLRASSVEPSARIAFGRSNIVLLSPSGDAMATFAPLDGLSLSVPLQAVEANIDNLAAATIDADTLRAGLVRRRL